MLQVGLADSGFYMDLDMFTPLKAFAVRPNAQNGSAFLAKWCRDAYVKPCRGLPPCAMCRLLLLL